MFMCVHLLLGIRGEIVTGFFAGSFPRLADAPLHCHPAGVLWISNRALVAVPPFIHRASGTEDHRLIIERSLALQRFIVAKLRGDPASVEKARADLACR